MPTNRAVIKPRKQCKIGDLITIDSCLDESHTLDNEITDHEVEQGFNISDHSRPKPIIVSLRCFVSNTPLSLDQMRQAVREGSTNSVQATEIQAVPGRGNDAYVKLKRLRDTGELVQLVTTLTTYVASDTEGMIVQSVSIPRNSRTFDGLEFSVTFKQIRIVKNKQTRDVQSRDRRVGKKKKLGTQTTKDASNEPGGSLAASSADSMVQSENPSIRALGRFFGGR